MGCNDAVNERAGKDMLLKICKEIECDILIGTADDPQSFLATAHGLAVGDLVRIDAAEIGTLDDVTAGLFYFVVAVPDANSFKISATPGGTAITFSPGQENFDVEVFQTLGGLREPSLSIAAGAVEATNYGSNQWRQILDGAGIRTVTISGSGVYTNDAIFRNMRNKAVSQKLTCLAFLDGSTGEIYDGCFKIVSFEAGGSFDGESSYSMSAESSGKVNISIPGTADVVLGAEGAN